MSVASNNSENEGDSEVSGTLKKRVNVKVIPDSFTEQRVKLIGRHIDEGVKRDVSLLRKFGLMLS